MTDNIKNIAASNRAKMTFESQKMDCDGYALQ